MANGVALKLRKGGHDGQHRLSHRSLGLQTLGVAAKADAASFESLDDCEYVLCIAPEPTDLRDRQHVSFAKVVKTLLKAEALGARSADAAVAEDAGRTRSVQCIELQLRVLVGTEMTAIGDSCFKIPSRTGFDTTVVLRQVSKTIALSLGQVVAVAVKDLSRSSFRDAHETAMAAQDLV